MRWRGFIWLFFLIDGKNSGFFRCVTRNCQTIVNIIFIWAFRFLWGLRVLWMWLLQAVKRRVLHLYFVTQFWFYPMRECVQFKTDGSSWHVKNKTNIEGLLGALCVVCWSLWCTVCGASYCSKAVSLALINWWKFVTLLIVCLPSNFWNFLIEELYLFFVVMMFDFQQILGFFFSYRRVQFLCQFCK